MATTLKLQPGDQSPVTIALKGPPKTTPKDTRSNSAKKKIKLTMKDVSSFDSDAMDTPIRKSNRSSNRLRAQKSSSRKRSRRFSKRKLQKVVSRRFDNTNKRIIQRALSQYLTDEEVYYYLLSYTKIYHIISNKIKK